jgi:hypothetical protein
VADQERPGMMLIRSRCALDAVNLWKQFHDELPSLTEPSSNELRDYRWRCSISRDDWIKLAGKLAEQVTYGNFKQAVHDELTQANKSGPYLQIWSTMAQLQRAEQDESGVVAWNCD